MSEDRKIFKIKDGNLGEVKIADEVVAIIAGLAATEVDGVGSMAGTTLLSTVRTMQERR